MPRLSHGSTLDTRHDHTSLPITGRAVSGSASFLVQWHQCQLSDCICIHTSSRQRRRQRRVSQILSPGKRARNRQLLDTLSFGGNLRFSASPRVVDTVNERDLGAAMAAEAHRPGPPFARPVQSGSAVALEDVEGKLEPRSSRAPCHSRLSDGLLGPSANAKETAGSTDRHRRGRRKAFCHDRLGQASAFLSHKNPGVRFS
jgi:hypothetical protein